MAESGPPTAISRAEQALLGALLIDSQAMAGVVGLVTEQDFSVQRHAQIYAAMLRQWETTTAFDFVTIAADLETHGIFQDVGGTGFLAGLVNQAPSSLNVRAYARQVADASHQRRIIAAGDTIREIGRASVDPAETYSRAQAVLDGIRRATNDEPHTIRSGLNEFFDTLKERAEGSRSVGVTSGFPDLDGITGGFQRGDLIILAARPSIGKSALAFTIARYAARLTPVLIFSLEMSTSQISARLVAGESCVDMTRIRDGRLSQDEWLRISQAFGTLGELPIFIDDRPVISVSDVRAQVRRHTHQYGVGFVVIDYLQLMEMGKHETRTQAVGEATRALKLLAREVNVPFLVLSQLSRGIESRHDHRPLLSDLRDSGSIEQDADMVIFLSRQDIGDTVTEVIVAKHRNGPVGQFPVRFFPEHVAFRSVERYRVGV